MFGVIYVVRFLGVRLTFKWLALTCVNTH